jgi:hypothetical protein
MGEVNPKDLQAAQRMMMMGWLQTQLYYCNRPITLKGFMVVAPLQMTRWIMNGCPMGNT